MPKASRVPHTGPVTLEYLLSLKVVELKKLCSKEGITPARRKAEIQAQLKEQLKLGEFQEDVKLDQESEEEKPQRHPFEEAPPKEVEYTPAEAAAQEETNPRSPLAEAISTGLNAVKGLFGMLSNNDEEESKEAPETFSENISTEALSTSERQEEEEAAVSKSDWVMVSKEEVPAAEADVPFAQPVPVASLLKDPSPPPQPAAEPEPMPVDEPAQAAFYQPAEPAAFYQPAEPAAFYQPAQPAADQTMAPAKGTSAKRTADEAGLEDSSGATKKLKTDEQPEAPTQAAAAVPAPPVPAAVPAPPVAADGIAAGVPAPPVPAADGTTAAVPAPPVAADGTTAAVPAPPAAADGMTAAVPTPPVAAADGTAGVPAPPVAAADGTTAGIPPPPATPATNQYGYAYPAAAGAAQTFQTQLPAANPPTTPDMPTVDHSGKPPLYIEKTQQGVEDYLNMMEPKDFTSFVAELIEKDDSLLAHLKQNETTQSAFLEEMSSHDPKLCKIFIRGLLDMTSSASLREIFGKEGKVVEANVVMDKQTGRSKGYGFITMASATEAKKVLETPQREIDGRTCYLNLASKPELRNKVGPTIWAYKTKMGNRG